MASFSFSFFLMLLSLSASSEAGSVGINYGRVANNLPSPSKVVELLKSQGLTQVKIFDTNADVLTALANSGIKVVVALANELLSSAAADQSFTDSWVQANIAHYHPATQFEAVAIGNEVFDDPNNPTRFLVPSMKNVHASLVKYNLDSAIKISSPIALSALQSSYPPSSGAFKSELVEQVMKPMLDFLRQTGSYFMVNAYPFIAYAATSDKISLDYALFKQNPGVVDSGNGYHYESLFDAEIDAVAAAMSALQYNDVKIVVSETGWPSKGDPNEVGANEVNAALYNGNLVRRVLSGSGTPLRPKDQLSVYLFALFNENQKPGPTSERNFGLFYPNERTVYDIPFTMAELQGGGGSKIQDPMIGGGSSMPSCSQTWCVANGGIATEKLQAGLDYACGEGGADCGPIQPGAMCYIPNTLEAHASYAFNSYYHKKLCGKGTCDFSGAAYVVTQPPKFGNCKFPTEGSSVPSRDQTWCVAKAGIATEKLQAGLDYACGEGGADCDPIQPGATCYNPNTLEAHASYAFNSYYQKKSREKGTCDFGGAAYVVSEPPKFGNCKFPTVGSSTPYRDQTWCVAKGGIAAEKLQAGLDYACGEGGADCGPIQPGATCYNPNTLEAHASYAFNSYYQKKSREKGTCDFGGAAYAVSEPPKFGNCKFPTGY